MPTSTSRGGGCSPDRRGERSGRGTADPPGERRGLGGPDRGRFAARQRPRHPGQPHAARGDRHLRRCDAPLQGRGRRRVRGPAAAREGINGDLERRGRRPLRRRRIRVAGEAGPGQRGGTGTDTAGRPRARGCSVHHLPRRQRRLAAEGLVHRDRPRGAAGHRPRRPPRVPWRAVAVCPVDLVSRGRQAQVGIPVPDHRDLDQQRVRARDPLLLQPRHQL